MSEKKWIASDGVTELKPGMLVLAKNGSGIWFVSLFSHLVSDSEKLYSCTNGMLFEHCIPLEGNEYMAGTTFPVTNKEKPRRGDYIFAKYYDGDGKHHVKSGMYVDFVEEKKPTPHAVICDYEIEVSFCHECDIDRERNAGEHGQR